MHIPDLSIASIHSYMHQTVVTENGACGDWCWPCFELCECTRIDAGGSAVAYGLECEVFNIFHYILYNIFHQSRVRIMQTRMRGIQYISLYLILYFSPNNADSNTRSALGLTLFDALTLVHTMVSNARCASCSVLFHARAALIVDSNVSYALSFTMYGTHHDLLTLAHVVDSDLEYALYCIYVRPYSFLRICMHAHTKRCSCSFFFLCIAFFPPRYSLWNVPPLVIEWWSEAVFVLHSEEKW